MDYYQVSGQGVREQLILKMHELLDVYMRQHGNYSIEIEYKRNEAYPSQKLDTYFHLLKKSLEKLQKSSQSQSNKYGDLFQKIDVKQNKSIIHTINCYDWELIQVKQLEKESQKEVYQSLFNQVIRFFKDELYVGSYNFQQVIKQKKTQIYSFLIFPGLMRFDDASSIGINLTSEIRYLVRQQIFNRTNKRLEILAFLKNFVIQISNEKDFQSCSSKFENGLLQLCKESIYLETQIVQQYILCTFQLAFDISRELDYDQDINKYKKENVIKYDFQLKTDNYKELYDLLLQVAETLILDQREMQGKRCVNQKNLIKKEQEDKEKEAIVKQDQALREAQQKLEQAFDNYYLTDYNKMEQLKSYSQELQQRIEEREKLEPQRGEDVKKMKEYYQKLKSDMLEYLTFYQDYFNKQQSYQEIIKQYQKLLQ